jgi:hypothetical protein
MIGSLSVVRIHTIDEEQAVLCMKQLYLKIIHFYFKIDLTEQKEELVLYFLLFFHDLHSELQCLNPFQPIKMPKIKGDRKGDMPSTKKLKMMKRGRRRGRSR